MTLLGSLALPLLRQRDKSLALPAHSQVHTEWGATGVKRISHFRESRLLRSARYRSKRDGISCNIDLGDVVIPSHCPALGIPLRFGSISDNSPTLDRIIPALGYTKGNVIVVANLTNRIKSSGTPLEVLRVAKFYLNLLKES